MKRGRETEPISPGQSQPGSRSAAPEPCPPEQNLALIAAYRVRAALGVAWGARLSRAKGVPVGAGLGGGSSDAATTLRLLRRLWNLERCTGTLGRIAAELGSDVPLEVLELHR